MFMSMRLCYALVDNGEAYKVARGVTSEESREWFAAAPTKFHPYYRVERRVLGRDGEPELWRFDRLDEVEALAGREGWSIYSPAEAEVARVLRERPERFATALYPAMGVEAAVDEFAAYVRALAPAGYHFEADVRFHRVLP